MDPNFSLSPEVTTPTPMPEQTYSYLSGSSSSSASPAYAFSNFASHSPYQFSDVGASTEPYVFNADSRKTRGGSVIAGSVGFGSVDKEFGGDFDGGGKPSGIVREDGGTGSFAVASSKSSTPSDQRPVAKVSIDDDDGDYNLGCSEARVLGATESGEDSVGGDKIEAMVGDGTSLVNSVSDLALHESMEYKKPIDNCADSSRDNSQRIVDEEVDTNEKEGEGKFMFDPAALAALVKAAKAVSDGGNVTITTTEKKKLDKLQQLMVKYLRLVNRLGVSTDDETFEMVLGELEAGLERVTSGEYGLETAKETALQLEAEKKDDLNFSLNILVLGKTGVGKSATINSIFEEEKIPICAFGPCTTSVKEIVGTVNGVKIRFFDTPGLRSAWTEQNYNRRILSSVKKVIKKCPPDLVIYVDRLDTQRGDLDDLPLLDTITSVLGHSIWKIAFVILTHAASSPPDGPTGSPLDYKEFTVEQFRSVYQTIEETVGVHLLLSNLLVVENHPLCPKNRDHQKVLPNGQVWRSKLLFVCSSEKILSEAMNLSTSEESDDEMEPLFDFYTRLRLPCMLSWLLRSRTHPKLSAGQGGDHVDSDVDLDDLSDSDGEEDEYDQLPSFKPLNKSQFSMLPEELKKAYLEEYDYRVKLLQKKQWRVELKRMKDMKGKVSSSEEYGYLGQDYPENGAQTAVPVALRDMALPLSFYGSPTFHFLESTSQSRARPLLHTHGFNHYIDYDSDVNIEHGLAFADRFPVLVAYPDMVRPLSFGGENPAYSYPLLEPTSQFLARPMLHTHGWDHDCGQDSVNIEHSLAIANRFPAAVFVQVPKDKKEFDLWLDSMVAAKHGGSGLTMAGFNIHNIREQLEYTVRGETKFKSFRNHKTATGVSVTFFGKDVSTGLKIEDQIKLGKRLVLVGTTGIVKSQSDSAYGASFEVRLREADFPICQNQSSLGLSVVKWRRNLALAASFQSQFSIGRNYKMAVRAGLSNKLSGQISVRTSSSEQLQIVLVAVLPIVRSICKILWHRAAVENHSLR